jgi:hypothetical protein
MTPAHTHTPSGKRSILVPVLWGLVIGVIQAGSPLAVRWLDAATVYALELVLIAAVYIGFAVADGRPWSSSSRPPSPDYSSCWP